LRKAPEPSSVTPTCQLFADIACLDAQPDAELVTTAIT
jgi:hypothetical protein